MVQASLEKTEEEEPKERVVRVLFAHLNSLIFSYAQLQHVGRSFETATTRKILRTAIENMITRLGRFTQTDNNGWDAEFTDALHLFAKAYTGRIDELVIKLEALAAEWNKPTKVERFKSYLKRRLRLNHHDKRREINRYCHERRDLKLTGSRAAPNAQPFSSA